jgi:hypothetical protein
MDLSAGSFKRVGSFFRTSQAENFVTGADEFRDDGRTHPAG